MKYILSILILFATSTLFAQTLYTRNGTIPITQDSITLQAGQFRGTIQWQRSLDGLTWENLTGKTSQIIKVSKYSQGYYRAEIIDGTCFPVYSDTAQIQAGVPIISTIAVSDITYSTAIGGGIITDDGGAIITARGICWNTTGSPTIADNKTTNGNGKGIYSSSLTNLKSKTTYYVRAYATNSIGTSYGNEEIATTIKGSSISLETNTQLIIASGVSQATFIISILDANDIPLSNVDYQIFANDYQLPGNKFFSTDRPGTYNIFVKAGDIESNKITIKAREDVQFSLVTIPVIFHVVHFGESIGTGSNLTSSQIQTALDKLNAAYSNKTGSTDPNAVDTRIRFRLATYNKDNQLLNEPGFDRIDGTSYDVGTTSGGSDVANDKKLGMNESRTLEAKTFWNPREYLNVWIIFGGSSVSSLPRVYESYPLLGLVTETDNCLCNPTSSNFEKCVVTEEILVDYVLAHEVGHVLGLYHAFSIDNCYTSDYCPDTFSYYYFNINQKCSDNAGTLISNTFMDYRGSYDTFTYDQRNRMRHVLDHGVWLNELKNSNK